MATLLSMKLIFLYFMADKVILVTFDCLDDAQVLSPTYVWAATLFAIFFNRFYLTF